METLLAKLARETQNNDERIKPRQVPTKQVLDVRVVPSTILNLPNMRQAARIGSSPAESCPEIFLRDLRGLSLRPLRLKALEPLTAKLAKVPQRTQSKPILPGAKGMIAAVNDCKFRC
jgi:hypothetical protein